MTSTVTSKDGGRPLLTAKFLTMSEDYMEKLGALSLELARPTGSEAPQGTWLDRSGKWGLPVSEIPAYLDKKEFNSSQVLRLPALCSGMPTLCIEYCCLVANESESFYRSVSKAQWLRTVITLQAPFEIFSSEQDDSKAGLVIRSNIVPRQVYLTRLEGTKTTCIEHQCTRGFFPISVLRNREPPCQSCTNCALPKLLGDHMAAQEIPGVAVESEEEIDLMDVQKESGEEVDRMVVHQLENFWRLEKKEVKPLKVIAAGSEGTVSSVLWRKGTFARKQFIPSEGTVRNTKFYKELDVARSVSHPNIVHCFGYSNWPDSSDLELFMEVLEEDLESFLDRLENGEPQFSFSFQDSLDVLLQVAEAVEHLHKCFIHGDLKPGNILMSKLAMPHSDVPFYLVKVADFGCAQRIHPSGTTVEGFNFKIGSPSYTAPEVYKCRKIDREIRNNRRSAEDLQKELQQIDPRKIDVYSFGVIAHKVVTNVSEGTTAGGDLPSLLQFFKRCSASKPEERPSFAKISQTLSSSIKSIHGLRGKDAKRRNHKNNTFGRSMMKKMKAAWSNEDSSSKC